MLLCECSHDNTIKCGEVFGHAAKTNKKTLYPSSHGRVTITFLIISTLHSPKPVAIVKFLHFASLNRLIFSKTKGRENKNRNQSLRFFSCHRRRFNVLFLESIICEQQLFLHVKYMSKSI